MTTTVGKRGMHERNLFRTPPDYTELAIKYKDFREVCTLELSGKVSVDYKNENALRMLTKTLLFEYFGLSVEFAPHSLIPALPLRLNYILWLEDLVNAFEVTKTGEVHGIDIGCGSSCVYALLAAAKNKWHMYALESNGANVESARANVERNQLSGLITVFRQQNKSIIFEQLFEDVPGGKRFQFCMCNPPFYDSALPNSFAAKSRNPEKRAPPHNCHTGRDEELACVGGEVRFVQSIIEESMRFAERVCIFTAMLGHKSSLSKVVEILESHEITNHCSTEFCQGRTTRWGIAWSFMPEIELKRC